MDSRETSKRTIISALAVSVLCVAAHPIAEATGQARPSTQRTQGGWEIRSTRLESAHPLGVRSRSAVEVLAPETTRRFRIHFSEIQLEPGFDFLIVKDEWGNEVERITGNHRDYLSRSISGRRASLETETDDSVNSWGFRIDELRLRGCEHNAPGSGDLEPMGGCRDLERAIRAMALREVRRRFAEGSPLIMFDRAEAAEVASAPAHSETNVQVQGVDEADIVETDGLFIYALSGRELRRYRSFPIEEAALVDVVPLEGWPRGMFLNEGRVVVLSGVPSEPVPMAEGDAGRFSPLWWRPDAFTRVSVIRFDEAGPVTESDTLLAGQYSNARRVGNSIRVVLHRQLNWPNLAYAPGAEVDANSRAYDAALDRLEADAVRQVALRRLEDWLPRSYRIVEGQRVALPLDCAEFWVPSDAEQMGLMAVVTIDVAEPRPSVQETSLLVDPAQIYQSAENLYVTSGHRWSCWEDEGREGQVTYVHKLDVSHPSRSVYLASGSFKGAIQSQFQLDEYQGHLRVASNDARWNEEAPELRSQNRVYVLGQRGSRLAVVGKSRDLAPGESIFGARFIADKGFVVTFRQVDPLFTLDLSNPEAPQVLGELKVPGFSTYLHPLDDTHLFTIGQDFEPDGTTRNGVALSIFDVSTLAEPRLAQKVVIGTNLGFSEALYEHKAFTMYREPGARDAVLAIPFTDYTGPEDREFWTRFRSTLKVYRVSPQRIDPLGELDHSAFYRANQVNEFGWWYQPEIRRGVFVDRYVFAVSDAGLNAAPIADLSRVLVSLPAPAPR